MNSNTRPYKTLWMSILLMILLSIIGRDSSIDIQLHDSYFVIALHHIGFLFSTLLGLLGLGYYLSRHIPLIDWLTRAHVLTTILIFISIMILGLVFREANDLDFDAFSAINRILFIATFVLGICQFVFIVNLVISAFRKRK